MVQNLVIPGGKWHNNGLFFLTQTLYNLVIFYNPYTWHCIFKLIRDIHLYNLAKTMSWIVPTELASNLNVFHMCSFTLNQKGHGLYVQLKSISYHNWITWVKVYLWLFIVKCEWLTCVKATFTKTRVSIKQLSIVCFG